MTNRIAVGVLGATGTVGQQFVALLGRHPWFELNARTTAAILYAELLVARRIAHHHLTENRHAC